MDLKIYIDGNTVNDCVEKDKKLELINFDLWLLYYNKLKYMLYSSGSQLIDNTLRVRDLKYHNKIYGLDIVKNDVSLDNHIKITFNIEENGIIDSYCISILNSYFIGLLKSILKYSSRSVYKDTNTEVNYAIIEYINILINNIKQLKFVGHNNNCTCVKFCQHSADYGSVICKKSLRDDTIFMPTELYRFPIIDGSKDIHICRKFAKALECNDLIKVTNFKNGHVTYGISNDPYNHPTDGLNDYNIDYFCIDIDTAYSIKPYKRGFYPLYILYVQSLGTDNIYKNLLISKASLDELNELQLIKYKKLVNIINSAKEAYNE